jgi:Ni,Fe-hydrogenase III large subunit/Ni,Fe-hydrogenase III component G
MIKEKIQQHIPEGAKVESFGNTIAFEVPILELKKIIIGMCEDKNLSLKLITATDEREENGCFKIWYVFGASEENMFIVPFLNLKNSEEFPSIALNAHKAWDYEKKIFSFFGLKPLGHPDLRPIILHENWPSDVFPLRKDFDWQTRPEVARGTYRFQKVKGEGIYEIPVGPIHAGIIEPGHFRFSVAGERIVLLEPRLGYTHKGSEKLFEILSLDDKVRLSEKISGDSSFSHSLAFCQTMEQLSNTVVPKRALYLRVVYAELERLANHLGDIGAIMTDTGFNFGGAHGSRLREMIMQINERLTGNRFLRGVNTVGGVVKDINEEEKDELARELIKTQNDFSEVIAVAENSTSLFNRLKGTGVLSLEAVKSHEVTGVAGKSVGVPNDARVDYPYAGYKEIPVGEIPTENDGDVYARFHVRIKETYASIKIIQNALQNITEGPINQIGQNIIFKQNALAVGVVEGWRGEIVYFATTDKNGNISRVAPRDPSFVNWAILKDAGFDNVVPDFPLINKSFNLSYSGNDL